MQILLTVSIALFAGLMLSRAAKLMNLPAVTAYLVAGIIIGPFLLGSLGIGGYNFGFSFADIEEEKYNLVSNAALGFIACFPIFLS